MAGKVSVLGLGVMGSALCRAFMRSGYVVTVWNRTQSKAETLVSEGATLARDVASAVRASPTVVICVDSHDVTHKLLSAEDVACALSGRTVLQMSSATSQEARASETWMCERGAVCLKGSILAFPEQILERTGAILVSGAETVFTKSKDFFDALAPEVHFIAEDIGAGPALESAIASYMYGSLLGAIHGASLCQAEGVSLELLAAMLPETVPIISDEVKRLVEVVGTGEFEKPHASLRTFAVACDILQSQARDSDVDDTFPKMGIDMLKKGMDAGLGDEGLAAMVKVLRKSPREK